MGPDNGKRPAAAHDSRGASPGGEAPEPGPVPREARYRAPIGYGIMQLRETAVVPFGPRIDEARYPEVVERILGHLRGVMREIREQQSHIEQLRDDTRAALARLKAA